MGACCSAGARDRQDTTIMPQPQNQERPPTGLSKLQTLRYQVHSRTSKPPRGDVRNENETPLLTPNDNQREENVNVNNNSPASTRSVSNNSSQRSDGNANVTSTMSRFGFGFKKPSNTNINNSKALDRSSRDSGKGSVDSLDTKGKTGAFVGRITPSSSTGSLTKTSGDRKPLVARSASNSKTSLARSSTTSLNSQGSRPQSPSLGKGKSVPLKSPSFKTTSKANVPPKAEAQAKPVQKDVRNASGQEEVGYRSSRLPAHARGPYLSRIQAQAAKSEPYTTSLPRSHKYQKNDQNSKIQQQQHKPSESKFGFRTTTVPSQLSFSKRTSLNGAENTGAENTPDSMTESIFNPEAPLATFDSLGSTSFMSQNSMASDDMILDFEDDAQGFSSVASTPGDDKSIEREFLSGGLGLKKARSKSIEAPRKSKNLGKSPLVIDSTDKAAADDSAYVSGNSDNLELTLLNSTFTIPPGALSPVLDVSTDTVSLDDADKTLSSSSLDCKSPQLLKQNVVDFERQREENGNTILSETIVMESATSLETEYNKTADEPRMRYRTRPRAATLQELTELIHETSPVKDPLQRTRSLSSPLKPPRPRSMSGLDEEETVMVDAHLYRQTMQEITTLKTLLHKLKRCLHEEDLGLLEFADQRRGLRASSFGSEGSLLDDCPLKRKSSQRSNPDTGGRTSVDLGPRERHASLSETDLTEENYDLRQQLAALRREVEEQDHTIHLLQQQMTKYETEDKSHLYVTSCTQTDTPSKDETMPTAPEVRPEPRSRLVKPSILPQPKHGPQQSNSVSDILAEISRKSNEKANAFRSKLDHMKTSLTDLNGQLRHLSQPGLRRGGSLSLLTTRSTGMMTS